MSQGDAHRETGFSVEEIRRTSDLRNSVYFTGILVSTAFIQLQVAGVVITALVAVLLYRPFWTMVRCHSSSPCCCSGETANGRQRMPAW